MMFGTRLRKAYASFVMCRTGGCTLDENDRQIIAAKDRKSACARVSNPLVGFAAFAKTARQAAVFTV
jgi:hypothetical protein